MSKVLYVDYDRCNGCELCALHCSFAKTGTFNPRRSRVQVIGWEEKGLFVPALCQHCVNPPCAPACPESAIIKDAKTGTVAIDYATCKDRFSCIPACPYAAITIDPATKRIIQCDLCGGDPVCAKVCPIGVIQYIDEDKLPVKREGYLEKYSETLGSMPGRLVKEGSR